MLLEMLFVFVQSYREYHDDIFPDTATMEPAMSAQQWLSDQNNQVSLKLTQILVILLSFTYTKLY